MDVYKTKVWWPHTLSSKCLRASRIGATKIPARESAKHIAAIPGRSLWLLETSFEPSKRFTSTGKNGATEGAVLPLANTETRDRRSGVTVQKRRTP